jgi:hypothetical protein
MRPRQLDRSFRPKVADRRLTKVSVHCLPTLRLHDVHAARQQSLSPAHQSKKQGLGWVSEYIPAWDEALNIIPVVGVPIFVLHGCNTSIVKLSMSGHLQSMALHLDFSTSSGQLHRYYLARPLSHTIASLTSSNSRCTVPCDSFLRIIPSVFLTAFRFRITTETA